MIKKNFKTGLLLLIPMIVTLMIVMFIINFLTNPFVQTLSNVFMHFDIFNKPFLFLTKEQTLLVISRLVALVGLMGFTILIGFLGKMLLMDFLLEIGDYLIKHIPWVNKIYKTSQEIVGTIFSSKTEKFSAVVLVPFPHANGLNIGLVANQTTIEKTDQVAVFVPGGPNPSIGFNLMFKKEELIFVDMKVEDALKFIVSCGVVFHAHETPISPSDQSSNKSLVL